MSALPEWAREALALGWPLDRLRESARLDRAMRAVVVLVTADVIVVRTERGATLRTLRDESAACLARANAATAALEVAA